jgi:hypothetical protein
MAAAKGYKRSWKNLFLDKGYQSKFTMVMVLSCAVFLVGLGYYVRRQVNSATDTAINTVKGQNLDGCHKDVVGNTVCECGPKCSSAVDTLISREHWINRGLFGVGILVCLGVAFFGIKTTHKVAGPLFKIGNYCDKVANDKFDKLWPLRKGDQLVEFYDNFRAAHDILKARQEKDVATLKMLLAAAERAELGGKSPELARLIDELRATLKTKEASLA